MKNAYSGGGLDYSMLMRAPNDLATLRNYYAQIAMVDDGVGRILETLDRLGMADDTIVIFTADHGLSMGQHGFWGHGAATYPANMHKAVHSVPLIVRYGDHLARGYRAQQMVQNMDIYATLADYAEIEPDGADPVAARSFRSALMVEESPVHEGDIIISEQEETRVARSAKWCYFKRLPNVPGFELYDELYDLEADPGETMNVVDDPAYSDVVADLSARIEAYFATYARSETNLWTGGRPIQNTERWAFWRAAWGAEWGPIYRHDQV